MKIIELLFPIPALLLCFGCGNPADKVAEATVSSKTNAPPESTKAAATASANARTYALGPENSTISFIGSKVTGKHDGGFKQFSGELKVLDGKLADTGNKIVIQ